MQWMSQQDLSHSNLQKYVCRVFEEKLQIDHFGTPFVVFILEINKLNFLIGILIKRLKMYWNV